MSNPGWESWSEVMRAGRWTGTRRAVRAAAVAAWLLSAFVAAGADDRIGKLVVFPSIDLAWGKADRPAVDALLRERLTAAGLDLVPESTVLDFLTRHRVRYTGGVTAELRTRLAEELGAQTVCLVSVDAYESEAPPRVALNARIVSLADGSVRWADEAALCGEQRPGALGRGEIGTVDRLLERAVTQLLESLGPVATGGAAARRGGRDERGRGTHRPKKVFRSAELDAPRERPARLAVLPFENQSPHPDAGDVIAGLFVTHLAGRQPFEIIPPGDVREAMLEGRVIQVEGLSLAQADFLRESLDADLAVTGRVLEYADFGPGTVPRVTFSVWVLDLRLRSVVWSGHSASRGDDGVVFFDVGRVRSARALASSMVRAAAEELASGKPTRASAGGR